jgi:DNA-binding MarR family transcriptional regulator
MNLADGDFQQLLALRTGLRRFLHWSEEQARAAGITPAQHQLLLAIRGHPGAQPPNVGEIADYLYLRHHSAVELIDRAEAAGLITRGVDESNRSVVRVQLTSLGAAKLDALSEAHLRELRQLAPTMRALWAALESADGATADGLRDDPGSRDGSPTAEQPRPAGRASER